MPCPGEYLRLLSLQPNMRAETKKHGPSERTDQKSEKELSGEEIAELSDAEFKTGNQDAHRND